jgi:hypothetical protein
LTKGRSGWRRMRAGRRTGRIQQDRVKRRLGLPASASAPPPAPQPRPRQVLPQTRAIRGPRCPAPHHLPPLPPVAASCRPARRKGPAPFRPAAHPSSRAGSAAAASCTHQPPCRIARHPDTCPAPASRRLPVGKSSPSGASESSRSVRSSGGSPACTASIAVTTSRPQACTIGWRIQRGSFCGPGSGPFRHGAQHGVHQPARCAVRLPRRARSRPPHSPRHAPARPARVPPPPAAARCITAAGGDLRRCRSRSLSKGSICRSTVSASRKARARSAGGRPDRPHPPASGPRPGSAVRIATATARAATPSAIAVPQLCQNPCSAALPPISPK